MLAVVNAKLMTVSQGIIEEGTIVIDDEGKIAALGSEVEPPAEARVIDAAGRPVTPGIVEAHGHLGISEQGVGWEGSDTNESSHPITPHCQALDAINPKDDAFDEFVEAGLTCVNVPPGSGNLLGGTSVALKCHGDIIDEMVLKNPTGMKAALGENPKGSYGRRDRTPSTRMGNAAVLREALFAAQEYWEKKEENGDDEDNGKGPSYDQKHEALKPVLDGEIPLRIHCHRADDIATAVRVAKEFELDFTLEHVTQGYLMVDFLKEVGASMAVGPTLRYGSKVENRDRDFRTPVKLAEARAPFCLTTDHPVIAGQYLPVTAGVAVTWGMDHAAALRSITLSAAEHIGVKDRVGSLEEGKDGDIVIWSDDPLDFLSFADYTIIDGEIVYEREV